MRVLAVGQRAYLGDLYLSLMREGHEVRVFAADPPEARAFGGILHPVADWRAELPWVGQERTVAGVAGGAAGRTVGRTAGGVVLFEGVNRGPVQDALRAEGYSVVGGSGFGDRLETDRALGQSVLAQAGLPTAWSRAFAGPAAALDWLERNPGAYVLKYDDNAHATFVGEHRGGLDVAFLLRRHPGAGRVLLMERLRGVEVGVGAYFDGRAFLRPACIDFEHKRFFPGELGEMTGEMGTLASYEGAERLFEATLGRVAPSLAAAGHVGYVNLNLIVDERGPFPLEFTCRFGNPGFAVLAAMQPDGWGDLLERMTGGGPERGTASGLEREAGGGGRFATRPGWAVAIVLTVPPFPATAQAGPEEDVPVFFHAAPDAAERPSYHFVDMRQEGGQLLGHRRSGHLMIVTGTGTGVAQAQAAARARAANVVAPEIRWRGDIGDRFLGGEGNRLRELGWL